MPNSTWDLIHAERHQLIDDLQPLTTEQWRTESLCPAWNVHQTLAHLVALTKQTPPKFFGKFAMSGFRFDVMVAKDVAREGAGDAGPDVGRTGCTRRRHLSAPRTGRFLDR